MQIKSSLGRVEPKKNKQGTTGGVIFNKHPRWARQVQMLTRLHKADHSNCSSLRDRTRITGTLVSLTSSAWRRQTS